VGQRSVLWYQLFTLKVLAVVSLVQHPSFKLLNNVVVLLVAFGLEGMFTLYHLIPLFVVIISLAMLTYSNKEYAGPSLNPPSTLPSHHESVPRSWFSGRSVLPLVFLIVFLIVFFQPSTPSHRHVATLVNLPSVLNVPRLTFVRSRVSELGCAESCAVSSVPSYVVSGRPHILSMAPAPLEHEVFEPLRLRRLFLGSPLELIILNKLQMWKLMSGPLFPDQLDFVVQLVTMYHHGGAAVTSRLLLQEFLSLQLEPSCTTDISVARDQYDKLDSRFMVAHQSRSRTVHSWLNALADIIYECIDKESCPHSAADLLTRISSSRSVCILQNRIITSACIASSELPGPSMPLPPLWHCLLLSAKTMDSSP
jgi:hypothetical protein